MQITGHNVGLGSRWLAGRSVDVAPIGTAGDMLVVADSPASWVAGNMLVVAGRGTHCNRDILGFTAKDI